MFKMNARFLVVTATALTSLSLIGINSAHSAPLVNSKPSSSAGQVSMTPTLSLLTAGVDACYAKIGNGMMTLKIAGGWVEANSGSGTDHYYYAVTWVKTKTVKVDGVDVTKRIGQDVDLFDAGHHNNHGGPSTQQLPKYDIFAQPLNQGETITMLISVFSTSDGGFGTKILSNLLNQLSKSGDSGIRTGNGYSAAGAEVAQLVAPIIKDSITPVQGLVGSIKVWFTKMPNGENNWDTQPYDGAAYLPDCPKDDAGYPTWCYNLTGNGVCRLQIQPIGPGGIPAHLN